LGLERKHVRLMAMDLSGATGAYVLISSVKQVKHLKIGWLVGSREHALETERPDRNRTEKFLPLLDKVL
jgi:hypothetical protein